MGWGYASSDDFQNFGMLEDLITVDPRSLRERYPLTSAQRRPRPPFYWLFPPATLSAQVEQSPTTVVSAWAQIKPDWIISPNNRMLPWNRLRMFYEARTPADTRTAEIVTEGGFGNAVDFFIAMLREDVPIADFDLDGDRGFGYKPWDELPPNERYI